MSIQFDSGKRVTAIGFSPQPSASKFGGVPVSSEWVYRTEAPKLTAYLVLCAFPVFGFLVPWAVARVVTWVGTGFFTPKAG